MKEKPESQVVKLKGIPSAESVFQSGVAAQKKLSPMERQIKAVNDKWDAEHQAAKDWLNGQPTTEARELAKLQYKEMVRQAAMVRVIAIKEIKKEGGE